MFVPAGYFFFYYSIDMLYLLNIYGLLLIPAITIFLICMISRPAMRAYFTTSNEKSNALIIVFIGGLFFSFVYSVFLYLFFKMDISSYQYTSVLPVNLTTAPYFGEYIYYLISASFLALDGISLVFILLTPFTIFICAAITHQLPINTTERVWYYIYLLLIELFLFLAFTTTNLLVFYFAFEAVLLPIFLIIGR
jgi:NADH:ubiquinone oxidoreductase subunit 4 (subunit M)